MYKKHKSFLLVTFSFTLTTDWVLGLLGLKLTVSSSLQFYQNILMKLTTLLDMILTTLFSLKGQLE